MYSFDEHGNPLIDAEKAERIYEVRARSGNLSPRFRAFFLDTASRHLTDLHSNLVSRVITPALLALNEAALALKVITRQYTSLTRASMSTANSEIGNLYLRMVEKFLATVFKGFPTVIPVARTGHHGFQVIVSFDAALIRYCDRMCIKASAAGLPIHFTANAPGGNAMMTLDGCQVVPKRRSVLLTFSYQTGGRNPSPTTVLRKVRAFTALLPSIYRFLQIISRRVVSLDDSYGEYSSMTVLDPWNRMTGDATYGLTTHTIRQYLHGSNRQMFTDRHAFQASSPLARHALDRVIYPGTRPEFRWNDPRSNGHE